MKDRILNWIERVTPCTCNLFGWCLGAWALRHAKIDWSRWAPKP